MKKLIIALALVLITYSLGYSGIVLLRTSGCSEVPCDSTTLDGDGSTSLVLCEQVGASDMNHADWNAAVSSAGGGEGTYEAQTTPCGDSYQWRSGDDTYVTDEGWEYSGAALDEYSFAMAFETPASAPSGATYLLYAKGGGDVHFYVRMDDNFYLTLRWRRDNGVDCSSYATVTWGSPTALTGDTTYILEVYFKTNQTVEGIAPKAYFYQYGTARTAWDLTGVDDSTCNASGLDEIEVRSDTEWGAGDGWKLKWLKVRDVSSEVYPPTTCCD